MPYLVGMQAPLKGVTVTLVVEREAVDKGWLCESTFIVSLDC